MVVQPKFYAIEDFRQFVEQPDNEGRLFELIHGEIVEVSPGRSTNSECGHRIVYAVRDFCRANNLPRHTFGGDAAFRIGEHVVAPDFAYKPSPGSDDYPDPVAPAWAVEIVSPTDKGTDIAEKRAIYVDAKLLYWEVYPKSKSVHVYAPDKALRVLRMDDTLDGGDVLPGFTMPVREVFED